MATAVVKGKVEGDGVKVTGVDIPCPGRGFRPLDGGLVSHGVEGRNKRRTESVVDEVFMVAHSAAVLSHTARPPVRSLCSVQSVEGCTQVWARGQTVRVGV